MTRDRQTGAPRDSWAPNGRPLSRDWSSTTLGERIEHVMRLRELNASQLGALAGIERGPMSRYLRPGEARKGGATPEVLARMADAWRVSFTWLAIGRGQPDDVQPWERSRSRSLEVAIAYGGARYTPDVVARARVLSLKRADDPAPAEWSKVLDVLQGERDLEILDPERARRAEREREEHTAQILGAIRVKTG